MAFPTTDWPTSVDTPKVVVDGDWIYATHFTYQDGQNRAVQTWLGEDGDLIGEGATSAQGPGGLASPVADGGTAVTLAAKADFTSGKLLSIGDNYDTAYSEKASVDFEGKAVFAGIQLGATTAVTSILDEDTMTSDSDTALATQQSIKAYVDAAVAVENLWDRSGTVLSPHTPGDTISVGAGAVGAPGLALGAATTGLYLDSSEILTTIAGSKTAGVTKSANIPDLSLYRSDTHGGSVDVGYLTFLGKDASAADAEYARITGYAAGDTTGLWSGRLDFSVATAGVLNSRWTMSAGALYGAVGGVYLLQSSGGVSTPEISWRGSSNYGMTLVSSEILHSIAGSKTTGIEKTSNIPYQNLYRMDTHGSDVFTGGITFYGKDAAGLEAEYAQVLGYADSATGGSEVGSLKIKTATSASGALTTCAVISGEGTEFDPGTRHKRQAVTSSSNQVAVDCENGYVVYHALTENTTIQPPTNEVEPAELIFLIDGHSSGYTISFQSGSTAGGFWVESSMPSLGNNDRLTIKFIYDSTKDAWIESSRTDVLMGSAFWLALNSRGIVDLNGAKFSFAVVKNKAAVRPTIIALETAQNKALEGVRKYEEARINLCRVFADKDESGEPKTYMDPQRGQQFLITEQRAEFDDALEHLSGIYHEELEEKERFDQEFDELLDEEVKVDIHMVKLSDVPDDITVGAMQGLAPMISEE
jgi:hypothetical protein